MNIGYLSLILMDKHYKMLTFLWWCVCIAISFMSVNRDSYFCVHWGCGTNDDIFKYALTYGPSMCLYQPCIYLYMLALPHSPIIRWDIWPSLSSMPWNHVEGVEDFLLIFKLLLPLGSLKAFHFEKLTWTLLHLVWQKSNWLWCQQI